MRKIFLLTALTVAALVSCKKENLTQEALKVSFTVTPEEPVTESEATFTVEIKGGEFPFTYEWNFGDDITGTKYEEKVTYRTPGEKKVSVKVTDKNGNTGFAEKTINVRDKSDVPQIEKPKVKEAEVSHSYITVQWAITTEPENDGTYRFELLEGQALVNKYTKEGKFDEGMMTFGGLKPSTAYKFRLQRVATGYDSDGDGEINSPTKIDSEWSELDITTAAAPAADPEAILTERFDNFIWGPNYLLGGYCFRAKDEKNARALDVETILANGSTGSYFATFTEDFRNATNTLKGWSGAQVYGFAGVAKLGSSSAYGMIETPALGKAGNFELEFDVIPFEEDRPVVYITVTGGGAADRSSINLEGRESGVWQTETVKVIDATPETRIRLASSEELAKNQRFAIDNVIIRPVSSDIPVLGTDISEQVFPSEGGEAVIKVNSNRPWSASSDGSWITLSPESGAAGETLVTVKASSSSENREAKITFSTTSGEPVSSKEVVIRQVAQTPLDTPVKVAEEITFNSIMVRWDHVDGADFKYHFELAAKSSPDRIINQVTGLDFENTKSQYKPAVVIGNLSPETDYVFKVKALAQTEEDADSDFMEYEFRTPAKPDDSGYILCERFDNFVWGSDYLRSAWGFGPENTKDVTSLDAPATKTYKPKDQINYLFYSDESKLSFNENFVNEGFGLAGWSGYQTHVVFGMLKLGNYNTGETFVQTGKLAGISGSADVELSFSFCPWWDEGKTTTDQQEISIEVIGGGTAEKTDFKEEFTVPASLKTVSVVIKGATADTQIKFIPKRTENNHRLFLDNIMVKVK